MRRLWSQREEEAGMGMRADSTTKSRERFGSRISGVDPDGHIQRRSGLTELP